MPGRIAAILERHADLSALRVRTRGVDPEATAVLEAIRYAAMSWRISATGNAGNTTEELPSRSKWLSTTAAADLLGMTRRGVGAAIARRNLPATLFGRVWRISREDLEHYRAARAA
jgi:excisionase family DNA binding protein